ncbi:GspE/PulE family protein [Fodinisporobacter ferrooxydans]|uniref:GspE/PulE family protein n=1 Tax=Fodinisporobacter ferrooxydans TaxID=2901836 RepID=A0ABY4CIA9_9BACL|nr:GspE/PulE family protein [Alicyclobacillaceae bacterium MYW30-H2]
MFRLPSSEGMVGMDELLQFAVEKRASDIHVEPYKHAYRVRLRVDGALFTLPESIPAADAQRLIIRLKNLAGMDISEKRRPQDGSFPWIIDNGGDMQEKQPHRVDVRISSMPTIDGEKLVLRLLYATNGRLSLEELGMDRSTVQVFRNLLEFPYGMILVTGPTGSGKSTTLYTALQLLNDPRINIVALEDPIEYSIQGITQVEINSRSGITFATGLRSLLRQDPNIIMIGEIRDAETAEIAIRAALTGHRVFSTLHTSDSIQAIVRLIDMGIEPYLVASALRGVIAQRLVRKRCPHGCMHDIPANIQPTSDHPATDAPHHQTGSYDPKFISVDGSMESLTCKTCNGTGYAGRTGAFEILPLHASLKRLISQNGSEDELRLLARKQGMEMLDNILLRYVKEGITDSHEMARWFSGTGQTSDISMATADTTPNSVI